MAVGDLYTLRVYYALPDSPMTIGLGYVQTGGVNDKDTLQSAVEFWVANFAAAFEAVLSVDADFDQVRMDQVSVGNEIPGIESLVGIPGTRLGTSLPASVAAVISWVTDAPNAKHNGRFYIGGISEADQVNGLLSVAILALLNTLSTTLQSTLLTSLPQTATFELATISRVLDGAPRVPPVGFLVESGVIRQPVHQQRRRVTKRRGHN